MQGYSHAVINTSAVAFTANFKSPITRIRFPTANLAYGAVGKFCPTARAITRIWTAGGNWVSVGLFVVEEWHVFSRRQSRSYCSSVLLEGENKKKEDLVQRMAA